uniref:glyoxal reductase-like isoform X1 n=2 Tax=Myxine glutinosa TaxID=7769 RepID=UPI00359004F9
MTRVEHPAACCSKSVLLNNGKNMPLVGLGTFRLRGYKEVYCTLDEALALGYRSFDTASVYRNEADIGLALVELLPKHGLTRGDVFLTSKLSPADHGGGALDAVQRSLTSLRLSYLDLYLVHWPGKQGWHSEDKRNPGIRQETWNLLEGLRQSGELHAVGISNYTLVHTHDLLSRCRVPPAVLQVEFHPKLVQRQLLDVCRTHGIHLQAYSSLGTGDLVSDPTVVEVSLRCGRRPAQTLLRWAVQQGIGVIPKSTNVHHLAENVDIFNFTLSDEDMECLNSLDVHKHYCWDPHTVM